MTEANLPHKNYEFGTALARSCLTLYQKALDQGLVDLKQDMDGAEPYDHDQPKGTYAIKDEYFNRANNVGMPFLQRGLTGISKIYFGKC